MMMNERNVSQRPGGRRPNQLRPVQFTLDYIEYPEGSVLIEMGGTMVLCNLSVEDRVPRWLRGSGKGWLTAKYALLPASTRSRTPRERRGVRGRTQEIQRLIGRSLRAALDMERLGERQLILDCDVLQADGGTRTASVTGGYVALALAIRRLSQAGTIPGDVLRFPIAAVSVGVVKDEVWLDLNYEEDSQAEVDLNVAMSGDGRFVEIQGTAEGTPFSGDALDRMLAYAREGIGDLLAAQREALS